MITRPILVRHFLVVVTTVVLAVPGARAGWLDVLKKDSGSNSVAAAVVSGSGLSTDEIAKGLKEALAKGAEKAVASLSKPDGFLKNADVKIPLPSSLAEVEKLARMAGQEKYADEFVTTMNRAAETAVEKALPIFSDALTHMTLEDAQKILNGPDDAATQYFKKTGGDRIRAQMLPVVKEATEKTGVTAAYKKLMSKAGSATSLLQRDDLNVDDYVTKEAAKGLFKMIAAEEKEIRKNPLARSTDLLKKVFSSATK